MATSFESTCGDGASVLSARRGGAFHCVLGCIEGPGAERSIPRIPSSSSSMSFDFLRYNRETFQALKAIRGQKELT